MIVNLRHIVWPV